MWKAIFNREPTATGIIVTISMNWNIAKGSMSIVLPTKKFTSSGVATGAIKVDTVVIPTEKATSPLHKKLIMFEDTPPGQQPTKTKPKVKPSDRLKVFARKIAIIGMIVN